MILTITPLVNIDETAPKMIIGFGGDGYDLICQRTIGDHSLCFITKAKWFKEYSLKKKKEMMKMPGMFVQESYDVLLAQLRGEQLK